MEKVKIHKMYNDAFYLAVGSEWYNGHHHYELCRCVSMYQNAVRFRTAEKAIKQADQLNDKWKAIQLRALPNGGVLE
tara:strand:- start:442 stop:672 length:231 start_codon:yes stop_codon:yes gene_type:complete